MILLTATPINNDLFLRRIREADGTFIEEEEQFTKLASSEFLIQQLQALLKLMCFDVVTGG